MNNQSQDTNFSDEEIALAASNYEAQEWLVGALDEAFKMSGLSLEELAAELGVSVSEAEEWISGGVDLTLSELRQLANAVDAHVTYRVVEIKTKYAARFEAISKSQWQESPWVPAHTGLTADAGSAR